MKKFKEILLKTDCGLEKSGLSRVAHNHKNPGSNPGAAIVRMTDELKYPGSFDVLLLA